MVRRRSRAATARSRRRGSRPGFASRTRRASPRSLAPPPGSRASRRTYTSTPRPGRSLFWRRRTTPPGACSRDELPDGRLHVRDEPAALLLIRRGRRRRRRETSSAAAAAAAAAPPSSAAAAATATAIVVVSSEEPALVVPVVVVADAVAVVERVPVGSVPVAAVGVGPTPSRPPS